MAQNQIPAEHIALLNTINKVEGFNPEVFAVEYTDLNSEEKRKRLPVMAQMAWFRLKYPEGKISISVSKGNDCFVATARIYPSYRDPVECFLSEATASRSSDPMKPSVSPREWAQTAAVGIALRNAGFGLQFNAAGDDFSAQIPNEFNIEITPQLNGAPMEVPQILDGIAPVVPASEPPREVTPEEKFKLATAIKWPTKKHAGRTLGEVLNVEPSALTWLADRYTGNPEASKAAKFICEYAMNQVSA